MQPRLTDGWDAAAATGSTVYLLPTTTDAMASAAAVKVWTVLATLALLTVLQVSGFMDWMPKLKDCATLRAKCAYCVTGYTSQGETCTVLWKYDFIRQRNIFYELYGSDVHCAARYKPLNCEEVDTTEIYKCLKKCTSGTKRYAFKMLTMLNH